MILVLSLAVNTAVVAVAGYNYYGSRSRPTAATGHSHEMEHHFYDVLGLSPNQLEQMTPLADAFHDRLKNHHSAMSQKKDAMLNLMAGEDIDPSRIEALRMEMAAIQGDTQQTVIAHVLDVKGILDASQQERFFDILHTSMTREQGMFGGTGEK